MDASNLKKKDRIEARVRELANANGGRITPAMVLEDAKSPDSPFHDEFEWSDARAAHLQRLNTARKIISSVKIEVKTSKTIIESVAYIRDPSQESDRQGYISVEVLRDETFLAKRAIRDELKRVTSALERARNISVGLDLEDEFEKLLSLTAALRAKLQVQAA